MSYLKNSFILLLILFICIVLTGCNKNVYEKNVITVENIYLQEDTEYYVFFYQDNCKFCDDCFETINNYINDPKQLNLYVCDLTNNQEIKRKFSDGQGPNGTYNVDNITVYTSLYISGVPSLIKINEKDVSYYVTSGRKNILAYFEYINDPQNHVHNFVDGKCICGEEEKIETE